MNEMTTNILDERTPIEIALDVDKDGNTTAKKLYAFLELNPSNYSKWVKTNITENEFATENEDFFHSYQSTNEQGRGRFAEDYKLTAHFAKKLSVKGNGARAEQAREYFTTVEERVKQKAIDYKQLSPSLQMAQALLQSQAEMELEQKRQAKEISEVKQTVSNMKEIFTAPVADWRAEINDRVREISIKSGIEFKDMFSQMYAELEQTAHCSLKRLCDNKRDRMEKAGNTKTAIRNETSKLAIIECKPQLKAIFENIVKRYAMAYCA